MRQADECLNEIAEMSSNGRRETHGYANGGKAKRASFWPVRGAPFATGDSLPSHPSFPFRGPPSESVGCPRPACVAPRRFLSTIPSCMVRACGARVSLRSLLAPLREGAGPKFALRVRVSSFLPRRDCPLRPVQEFDRIDEANPPDGVQLTNSNAQRERHSERPPRCLASTRRDCLRAGSRPSSAGTREITLHLSLPPPSRRFQSPSRRSPPWRLPAAPRPESVAHLTFRRRASVSLRPRPFSETHSAPLSSQKTRALGPRNARFARRSAPRPAPLSPPPRSPFIPCYRPGRGRSPPSPTALPCDRRADRRAGRSVPAPPRARRRPHTLMRMQPSQRTRWRPAPTMVSTVGLPSPSFPCSPLPSLGQGRGGDGW